MLSTRHVALPITLPLSLSQFYELVRCQVTLWFQQTVWMRRVQIPLSLAWSGSRGFAALPPDHPRAQRQQKHSQLGNPTFAKGLVVNGGATKFARPSVTDSVDPSMKQVYGAPGDLAAPPLPKEVNLPNGQKGTWPEGPPAPSAPQLPDEQISLGTRTSDAPDDEIIGMILQLCKKERDGRIPCRAAVNALTVPMRRTLQSKYWGSIEAFVEKVGADVDLYVVSGQFIGHGAKAGADRHGKPSTTMKLQCMKHCDVCKCDVPEASWFIHVYGKKHTSAVFDARRKTLKDMAEGAVEPPPGVHVRDKHVWCGVCNAEVSIGDDWQIHVKGAKHQQKLFEQRKRRLAAEGTDAAKPKPRKPTSSLRVG